jgi:DNA repair exonuclease SbcCD ATPase subunit
MTYKKIIILLIELILLGCQNNEMKALNAELEELKISLNDADKKIETLQSRNKNLKQDLENAKFKFRNLETQMTEINACGHSNFTSLRPYLWCHRIQLCAQRKFGCGYDHWA